MSESKKDRLYEVYSYNMIDSIVNLLYTLGSIGLLILCMPIEGKGMDWWFYLLAIIICLHGIGATAKRIIIDYKFIFDSEGFSIIERNRITDKEIKTLYRWDDIQSIKFDHSYSVQRPKDFLLIKKKKENKEDIIEVKGAFQHSKFTKLARQYSERDNIIKDTKKRKPFEKDW